ncbi:hypothetical protein B9Z19DRAFT_1126127 [Tuber borchii]|uniref:Uncharacterized protein n=1 Tax=Tuber borchii TaxID=42251 RepID=A0A2T6ZTF8_TUBBO|nr:hypothetical protein B9Z19DRAFT_1126127 [Tuber borchii]
MSLINVILNAENLITQMEKDRIILEDGEDIANMPEEEEESEEEVIDLVLDNGDQSDPFESHFASPTPFRLASISSPSQGSEQTTGGRRIEGLKDLNLKMKLVAEELTPLQKSLGQLVFNYVRGSAMAAFLALGRARVSEYEAENGAFGSESNGDSDSETGKDTS